MTKLNTGTNSTLEYTSPETMNHSVFYKQSDIYSFGVLMYEVLTEENYCKKEGFEFIADVGINNIRPQLVKLNQWPLI